MTTTGIRIPSLETKLSGANDFPTWRQHMQDMLIINDLMEIVDGTEGKPDGLEKETKTETPEEETSEAADKRVTKETEEMKKKRDEANKRLKEWTKKDTIAKVYIHQNIKAELAREIPVCHTSKEIWQHIVTKFDRKSPSSLHKMHRKLLSLQCTTANGLTAHLAEFTKLWSALLEKTQSFAKTGLTVDPSFGSVIYITCTSEEAKAAYLLHSLQHPSFANIVEVLEAKDNISFAEVYEKLANLGETRQTNNPPTAFAAQSRKPCGYCAARSKPATHDFSVCRKYKRDQEQKKEQGSAKNQGQTAQVATEVNLGAWIASGPTYQSTLQEKEFEESTWIEDLKYFRDLEAYNQMEIRKAAETLEQIKQSEEAAATLVLLRESAFSTLETTEWLFDTGATSHMIGEDKHSIATPHSGTVSVAGGRILQITGTLTLTIPSCSRKQGMILENVYLVPELGKMKLLSWRSFAEEGYSALMKGREVVLYNQEDEIVGRCQLNENGGFILKQPTTNEFAYTVLSGTSLDWHKRLGHPSEKTYNRIRKHFPNLPPHLTDPCDACLLGKAIRQPRPRTEIKSTKILQLVHTDLSGRFSTKSISGSEYYILIIDDFSQMGFVYFLKRKSDATAAITAWLDMIENLTEKRVKRIRRDNGGEYEAVKEVMQKKGIIDEPTTPYSHQSNGASERLNGTVAMIARTSLIDSGLPPFLWEEAISTANYVKNRTPHSSTNKIPIKRFLGKDFDISHLKAFGERTFSHIPVEKQGAKNEARAIEGRFVGYGQGTGMYRIYVEGKRQILLSRDVRFPGPKVGEARGITFDTWEPTASTKIEKTINTEKPEITIKSPPFKALTPEELAQKYPMITPLLLEEPSQYPTDLPGGFIEEETQILTDDEEQNLSDEETEEEDEHLASRKA